MKKYDTIIFFQCELHGEAADMVLNKIDKEKASGQSKFGKQRAVQELLCEMWKEKSKPTL